MKNNIIIFSVIVSAATISGWFMASTNQNSLTEVKAPEVTPASTVAPVDATRSIASVKKDLTGDTPYLKALMDEAPAQKVYSRSREIFKDLPQGEALSRWITLGLRFDSSQEFGEEFQRALAELNEKPDVVLEAIRAAYGKPGNEDSFIQSMLVNVVNQLDVPKEDKVNFYTERLSDKFALDASGEPTASSLNLTNSMAFLKQYETEPETVKAKIESSLSNHRDDKKTQQQLAERFAAYFPELEGDIKKWSDQ